MTSCRLYGLCDSLLHVLLQGKLLHSTRRRLGKKQRLGGRKGGGVDGRRKGTTAASRGAAECGQRLLQLLLILNGR
jgi:hypothetical protein